MTFDVGLDDHGAMRRAALDVLARLRRDHGDDIGAAAAEIDVEPYLHDCGGRVESANGPAAVVFPRCTDEVAAVLRACHYSCVPIVPQGGLTGMAGGAVPAAAGIVLSLSRLRSIEEVDLAAATMTVQAGVSLQVVQDTAEANGMMFPLDLGARGSCLIGGNVSTNAGGNRVLRFGTMRELVLGLEVVLADGTVIRSLNKMLKNSAGYDLKHLFIGSEGTLGVVTRAVLRLVPRPTTRATALCALHRFADVIELLRFCKARLGAGLSAFEVMWQDFYVFATRARRAPLPPSHAFYVLIETLGTHPTTDGELIQELLAEALDSGLLASAVLAQSGRETDEFWAIRDASGEIGRTAGPSVNFDISIPIGDIERFVGDCRRDLAQTLPGTWTLAFGHIADSNIHLSCGSSNESLSEKQIEDVVYGCVRRWRGSVSAEHGIGLCKREYLHYSRTAEEIYLMRLLKHALDPNGILNPGKVLPAGEAG